MTLPPNVVEIPLREVAKAIFFDLRVYEAGLKFNRNVLMARNAIQPPANFINEQSLVLPKTVSSPSTWTLTGATDNTVTIMVSSSPVHVYVLRDTGLLDLGSHTMLILTSPLLNMTLVNESTSVDSEIEIIHA